MIHSLTGNTCKRKKKVETSEDEGGKFTQMRNETCFMNTNQDTQQPQFPSSQHQWRKKKEKRFKIKDVHKGGMN